MLKKSPSKCSSRLVALLWASSAWGRRTSYLRMLTRPASGTFHHAHPTASAVSGLMDQAGHQETMSLQQVLLHSRTPCVETLTGGKGVAQLPNFPRRGNDLFSVENCCNLGLAQLVPSMASDSRMVRMRLMHRTRSDSAWSVRTSNCLMASQILPMRATMAGLMEIGGWCAWLMKRPLSSHASNNCYPSKS